VYYFAIIMSEVFGLGVVGSEARVCERSERAPKAAAAPNQKFLVNYCP